MNYTCVVAGGWLLFCVLYYFIPRYGGIYWFKGPLANVELEGLAENAIVESTSFEEKSESISHE